jgi:hypothetical protein
MGLERSADCRRLMSDDQHQAVLKAEQRRSSAMLSNNLPALDEVLHEDLYFSHATGAVDNKAAYLAKMASGRITYQGISWSEQSVTPLGTLNALLTGRMLTSVRVEGVDKQLDNRVMSAWSNVNGTWRLLAFQSTPVKT